MGPVDAVDASAVAWSMALHTVKQLTMHSSKLSVGRVYFVEIVKNTSYYVDAQFFQFYSFH